MNRDARHCAKRSASALRQRAVWCVSSGPLDVSATTKEIPPVKQVASAMASIGAWGHLTVPIVGISTSPGVEGYWLVGANGGVHLFGAAVYYGDMSRIRLNQPVVGISATSDGGGYWLVAADGGRVRVR
jgi:hypothetical protein